MPPLKQVRAVYDVETITVYQAYGPDIAVPAVLAGRFVSPFSRSRMTWIKPSFLWMMYRSGWATKPGQERVLAIRITRAGFEEALASACLTHFDPDAYPTHEAWQACLDTSPVRVQWDPERSVSLAPLAYRSIQVGLGGSAALRYVDDWIVSIDDITERVSRLRNSALSDSTELPQEVPYPLPDPVAMRVGATAT